MNKARITYRLDQNRSLQKEREQQDDRAKVIPLYEEEYRVVEEPVVSRTPDRERQIPDISDYQPLEAYKTDYGAWDSPFDAETRRIEEMIRLSGDTRGQRSEREPRQYEPAAEDSRYDGQTGYYDSKYAYESGERGGYGRQSWDGPAVIGPRYVRHSRPPWIKVTVAVAGAAATGIMLGLLALSLFSGDGLKKTEAFENLLQGGSKKTSAVQDAAPSSASGQADGKLAAAAGTAATGTNAASAQSFGQETSIGIPAKNYVLLQNGSFAGPQGAEQAIGELKKKGLAAASEQADRYYVYAGLAPDKESAQALSRLLQNAKVDIYAKAYALPAVAKGRWSGDAETLKSYLDQSDKLVQMFSKLTLLHLEEEKPTPIDDSTLQGVKTAHEAWSSLANNVSQKAPDEAKPALQQMNNALNAAKQSIDQYKKNPSAAMLWQVQNGALQFLIAEKELLNLIAVKS